MKLAKNDIYKRNLFIPFLKMCIDAFSVVSAVLFSYYLRFFSPLTELIPVTKGLPSFDVYLYFSGLLVALYLIAFGSNNAYRSRYFSSFTQDIPSVMKTCVMGILLAMSSAFLYRDFSFSRLVFLLIFINTNLFLLFGRYVFHQLKKKYLQKGYSTTRVCLIGNAKNIPLIYQRVQQNPNTQFQIVGYFCDSKIDNFQLKYFGKTKDFLTNTISDEDTVDGVIISFEQSDHAAIWSILKATEGKNFEIFYVPDVLDILTSRFHTVEVGGIPLLQLKSDVLSGWQGLLKRGFDFIVSLISLILLSPFFLMLGIFVKLSSPGPVFTIKNASV